jgi:hypothetical protein
MTITANDIITWLWELANTTPSKTRGKKTGSQKSALKLLLDIRGGLEFIVRRPEEELEELERQGICSANLRAVLRELARVELQRRQALRDLAGLELQERRLLARIIHEPSDYWPEHGSTGWLSSGVGWVSGGSVRSRGDS